MAACAGAARKPHIEDAPYVIVVFEQAYGLEDGRRWKHYYAKESVGIASMEKLAQYVGLSRPSLMKLVAHDPNQRSTAKAETALKLARAFGIDLSDLYRPPKECLQAVVDHFEDAPITSFDAVPELRVRDVLDEAVRAGVVVRMAQTKGGRKDTK